MKMAMKKMKIAVTGYKGRTGSRVVSIMEAGLIPGLELVAKVGRGDNESFITEADVVIDFTSPSSALRYAAVCAEHGKIFVSGTTAWSDVELVGLEELARGCIIFLSYNMSIGINVISKLAHEARLLLSSEYECEVLDFHHSAKTDAPSGTALLLGQSVARAAGVDLKDVMRTDRNGHRKNGEIGFASLRAGGVVGEHSVIFASQSEIITISHQSLNRDIFAIGALKVARWLYETKPACGGIYSMQDFMKEAL